MQRDLASADVWEDSLRRSRERRERAAAAHGIDLPAKTRSLSVATLVALTGVPITGVAVAKVIGGGDDGAPAATAATPVAVAEKKKPADRAEPKPAPPEASVPALPAHEVVARSATPPAGVAQAAVALKPEPRPKLRAAVVRNASTPKTRPAALRTGGGVKALQAALGVPVDGDFGKATEQALKRWQRSHGLTADGVAGAATRAKLGLGKGKVLKREKAARKKRGSRRVIAASNRKGGGVSALQRALGLSGDGVFGPATEQALKRWQSSHGLTADGVAGPQTRRKLGIGSGPVLKRKRAARRGGGGGGGGNSSSTVQRVISAANAIATKPYRYGGGHGSFQDSGYDCSGSVSYALHGGGLLDSPLDSTAFMSYGKPGPGKHITIYANSGHVFMTINGRRFDTSARSQTGSRWGGPRSGAGYVVRHPAGF